MALILAITNAGRAALRNADASGTRAVRIASVGISAAALAATVATAALPGEIKRITTVSGAAVAADIIHLTVSDETMTTYTVRSFALYLDDGTLFAAYGQADPIIEKSAQALMVLTVDVTLADITAAQITFGDANFLMPPATVERQGLIELATLAEAKDGTDATRAVTPATAKGAVLDWLGYIPVQTGTGVGQKLNVVKIGWSGSQLKVTVDSTDMGGIVFDSGVANVWRTTNDGAGSGLDADLLDGRQAAEFALLSGAGFSGPVDATFITAYPAANPTSFGAARQLVAGEPSRNPAYRLTLGYYLSGSTWRGTINAIHGGLGTPLDMQASGGPTFFGGSLDASGPITQAGAQVWHTANDGAGSGLDADLLDGQDSSWYTNITARLGYTPVQMGTGVGQLINVVKIGWSGSRLKATVDASDMGSIVFDANVADVWRSGNDGSGSGLDADLLDGRQGTEFALLSGAGFSGPVDATFITAYPAANPTSFGAARQLVAGEPSRNPTYRLTLGYYLSGSTWRGTINAIHGGLGTPLDMQASGGPTFFGGSLDATGPITQNGAQVWHTANDGAGSGLDADLLDGQDSSWYTNITARLGYTPVQMGTGVGQLLNAVKIGWSGSRLKATVDASDMGSIVFDANLADVWRSGNDGSGSGLDADMLDGQDGSWYTNITARLGYTPVQMGTGVGQLLNAVKIGWTGTRLKATIDASDKGAIVFDSHITDVWRSTNDGAGSGLDADMLDGQDGSWYTNITARLGYTPVQMGTGVGQLGNVVKLGWTAAGRVKVTVDASDQGAIVFDSHITDVWRSSNDGAGSGLDADLLDGCQATDFALLAGADFAGLARGGNAVWDVGNDGAGSGLDADLLDGRQADEFSRVTAQSLNPTGYRVHADGFKECWGSSFVAAARDTFIPFPIPHEAWCVPVGSAARPAADEANIGVFSVDMATGGFTVRNGNPGAVTFYWHTRGV